MIMPKVPKKLKRRDGKVRNQLGLFDPPPKKKVLDFDPVIKGVAYLVRTADGKTAWTDPESRIYK